jgi:hypothetical protein
MNSSYRGFDVKIEGSAPIKKGTGASRTSIMLLGRIGMSTCFHENGNRNDIKATQACVRRALYLEIIRTFFSAKRARNISTTCSALKDLNRPSISARDA